MIAVVSVLAVAGIWVNGSLSILYQRLINPMSADQRVGMLQFQYGVADALGTGAPQAELQKLKERHGWKHIPWYTITDDWDKDFGVDEWHGHNAFIREGDQIYRTYFIDSRGDEAMGTTWSYLDMAPLGRQEDWDDSPEDYPQTAPYGWWDYNDAYGA